MRIVLAGAESPSALKLLSDVGTPSILMSYFYLRKKSKEKASELMAAAKKADCWVLLDSGAHTFFQKFPWLDPRGHFTWVTPEEKERLKLEYEASGKTVADALTEMDDYVKGYIDWLQDFGASYVDVFAELDVDALLGSNERVNEWREWFKEAGLVPMPTCHSSQSARKKEFNKEQPWTSIMDGTYPHIGLEGGWELKDYEAWFTQHRQLLEANKVKVHGWAMTNLDAIRKLPFFSVDSTSWLMGAQYGVTYHYVSGSNRIRSYDSTRKAIRKEFKAECIQHGVDFDLLMEDKGKAVNHWNAIQWKKFAVDLLRDITNAYWLSDEEKAVEVAASRKATGMDLPQLYREPMSIEEARQPRLPVGQDPRSQFGRFCTTCFVNARCPEFAFGSTCSISFRPDIKGGEDLYAFLMTIVEQEGDRVQQALFIERLAGGYLDEKVSAELDRFFRLAQQLKTFTDKPQDEVEIKAKGSVVAEMFAAILGGDKKKTDEAINITPEKEPKTPAN